MNTKCFISIGYISTRRDLVRKLRVRIAVPGTFFTNEISAKMYVPILLLRKLYLGLVLMRDVESIILSRATNGRFTNNYFLTLV